MCRRGRLQPISFRASEELTGFKEVQQQLQLLHAPLSETEQLLRG